jgi:hypothetical protein
VHHKPIATDASVRSGSATSVQRCRFLTASAVVATLLSGCLPTAPVAPAQAELAAAVAPRTADFGGTAVGAEVRQLADQVAASADNQGAGFVIIDKPRALLYVFSAGARLRGQTAVLLGSALGDVSVPGIGQRPIALVRPDERTTPAGRFVAEPGRNSAGEDVVWVDYAAAVSMHRVRANQPRERRLERLASPTSADNRISYGCINVPVRFYEAHVRPTFARQRALVYILPDHVPPQQVAGR